LRKKEKKKDKKNWHKGVFNVTGGSNGPQWFEKRKGKRWMKELLSDRGKEKRGGSQVSCTSGKRQHDSGKKRFPGLKGGSTNQ